MRYMMLVRKLSAQGRESGMLIAGRLLGGADASARVRLAAGKIGVTDQPFPETKEVIGGYAMLEYAHKKAALEGCAGFLELHREHWPGWEGEIEMRPIIDEDHRTK
jgi:hypothetical protein